MKKFFKRFYWLFIIIAFLSLLFGCESKVKMETKDGGTLFCANIRKIDYEGHEYLILMDYNRMMGITHSANCPCVSSQKSE